MTKTLSPVFSEPPELDAPVAAAGEDEDEDEDEDVVPDAAGGAVVPEELQAASSAEAAMNTTGAQSARLLVSRMIIESFQL
jgi:hypothetical protein